MVNILLFLLGLLAIIVMGSIIIFGVLLTVLAIKAFYEIFKEW